jgi:hypothetical protein
MHTAGRFLVILFVACFGSLASRLEAVQSAESRADAEERTVYQVVIEDIVQRAQPGHTAHVAIRAMTTTGLRPGGEAENAGSELKKLIEHMSDGATPLDADLRASYLAANSAAHPFPADLKLSVPHATEAFDLSPRDFWAQFYRKYPGSAGIVGLSRVGFNSAFTQALVYREHLHANMGASGEFVLLTRDARGWHLAKTFPYWTA